MMYLTSQEVVQWDSAIPWVIEALAIDNGTKHTESTQGLTVDGVMIQLKTKFAEFIVETGVLQDEITLPAQKGVNKYTLYNDNNYIINTVKQVRTPHGNLIKSPYRYDGKEMNSGFYSELPNNTFVIPTPDRDQDEYLSVWATFRMSPRSCGIPIELFDLYGRRIAFGAVADAYKISLIKGDVVRASERLIRELEQDYESAVYDAKEKASGLLGGGVVVNGRGDIDELRDVGYKSNILGF